MALDPIYDTKTIDELMAEFISLGDQLSVIDNKRKDIFALIEKRKAKQKAQAKIASLTDMEKEALLTALGNP